MKKKSERAKVAMNNKISNNSSNSQISDESEVSMKLASSVPRVSIAKPLFDSNPEAP